MTKRIVIVTKQQSKVLLFQAFLKLSGAGSNVGLFLPEKVYVDCTSAAACRRKRQNAAYVQGT